MTAATDLALVLERMALRLRTEGDEALRTTRSWADTLKAASYSDEPGGNRWEKDSEGTHPVPNDPTGDQAVEPDPVAQKYGQLRKLMRQAGSVCADMECILDEASHDPSKHPKRPDGKLDEGRWCKSCKTDRGHLEPVAVQTDREGRTRVKYKDECRWCHDFKVEFGRHPTPTLLRKRHSGQRITVEDIRAALTPPKKASA